MTRILGVVVMLSAFVVMLGVAAAQDPAKDKAPAQPPVVKGAPKTVEDFLAKYDTNSDKKVTKEEYMKVATKDAETTWDSIAGPGGASADEAKIKTYIDSLPAAFGGKGMGKGMMGKGMGKGMMGKGMMGKGAAGG